MNRNENASTSKALAVAQNKKQKIKSLNMIGHARLEDT